MFNNFLSVHRGLYCHFLSGPMSFLGDLPPGEGISGGKGVQERVLVLAFWYKPSVISEFLVLASWHIFQKVTYTRRLPAERHFLSGHCWHMHPTVMHS